MSDKGNELWWGSDYRSKGRTLWQKKRFTTGYDQPTMVSYKTYEYIQSCMYTELYNTLLTNPLVKNSPFVKKP